ncbi:CPBP family intramembrane metalloprotease [Nocardiopsis sp. EMB25]|uniref:CPBP family intramembrane glutamic endopeptidase n=1 Tax=Nocardiopsis sp. EMB25 TaxID=2835867 RepID=UPI002283D1BE|nr:CPBP family intramembrane glutamic endopeptidase [Nocardiopsis sp. EMB25]MCY9786050.1 CPBP family intramembrane metalloprotease [Nocardiopsis sp. EMB25]
MNAIHGSERATAGVRPERPPVLVRVILVTVGALLVWLLMGWVDDTLFPAEEVTTASHVVNALLVFVLAVPLVWAARRFLDRRPWGGLGLTGVREGRRPFLVGAAAWALPGAAGIALCVAMGWASVTAAVPWTELLPGVLSLAALVLVFEAVPEELIFRGYLYRNLNAAMPAWLAVLAQAALFALFGTGLWVILNGWGVLAERLPLFLGMGIVLGGIRLVTGNLWACVGFHLVFQTVAQTMLSSGYVEVRGVDAIMSTGFLAPFVFGVPTVMLLSLTTGDWGRRVPDPIAREGCPS